MKMKNFIQTKKQYQYRKNTANKKKTTKLIRFFDNRRILKKPFEMLHLYK